MASARLIEVLLLVVISLGAGTVIGHSYSCQQPCDTDACPPTNYCKGGLVDDICGCCQTCAKLVNETCGGIDNIFGSCDEGLYCAVPPPAHGDPITANEIGTCQQKPDHLKPCDRLYYGCNIENMECVCDTTVKACTNPYQFSDKKECRRALSLGAAYPDCSGVQCPLLDVPNCPEDSQPSVVGIIEPGACCPAPPECVCDFSVCIDVTCPEGHEKNLLHAGTKHPGSCCDVFECSKIESPVDCSSVICIEVMPIICQVGSKMVSGGISEDGCCLLPERCECVEDECQPTVCEPGFQTRFIARATGQPGSCCDVYECVNKTTSEWCSYKEQIYEDGATWQTESCLFCECRRGVSHCLPLPECGPGELSTPAVSPLCLGAGKFYSHGQVWNRDDCTTCRCNFGEVQCTATSCAVSCMNPIKIPGRCCPYCEEPDFITLPPPTCPPFTCTLQCEHGHQTDTNGCPQCRCKGLVTCEALTDCDKDCSYGYKTDRNGCEICKCRHMRSCPAMEGCTKQCTFGYQRNKHGCDKCKCEKCPVFDCDKVCTYGFETNDNGCTLCKCKAAPTPPVSVIPVRSCIMSDGQYHDNGESWHDGCRNCYCHNGQEMCQLISCPRPACSNPEIRAGDCCPSCPDESESSGQEASVKVCHSSDGEYYVEGETWNVDGCTLCVCYDGHVLCSSMTCPPVPCDNPVLERGSCCPLCPVTDIEVTTTDLFVPAKCKSATDVEYSHEDTWKEDDCTSCMCRYGEITCYSHVCPVVQCKTPVLKKGQCCPTCLDSTRQRYCEYENQIYTDGERWNISACVQCHCKDGKSECQLPDCPVLRCTEKALIPGECCPRCIDDTPLSHLPFDRSTRAPKVERISSTTNKVVSTSRSTSRPRTTEQKTHQNEVFTTEEPLLSTRHEEEASNTSDGISAASIVLPIVSGIAVVLLVVLVVVCVRLRRKSSEWHLKTTTKPGLPPTPPCKAKNMDLKNSNSIYNSAATTKESNVYVDPSKLNYDCEMARYSGMYSMGNNKLGHQL